MRKQSHTEVSNVICKFCDSLQFYANGKRLPIPVGCPIEVYNLMTECWGDLGGPRKQPQAIMRDINQILYQVYNSRRTHAYATAFPKLFNDPDRREDENPDTAENNSSSDCESRASSLFTDRTSLPWDDGDDSKKNNNNNKLVKLRCCV